MCIPWNKLINNSAQNASWLGPTLAEAKVKLCINKHNLQKDRVLGGRTVQLVKSVISMLTKSNDEHSISIPHLGSVNKEDPSMYPDSEYESAPMGHQLKKQYYTQFISALDVAFLDALEDAMNPTRHHAGCSNNHMSPVTQPNILPVNHPIGVWTSTTPCFNLVPTEPRKTSKDTTDETAIDFSTSGDDVNDKMNADFSTPSNNKKKTRDNNDTELTIIITTAMAAQVPSKMTTKLTAAEAITEVDQA